MPTFESLIAMITIVLVRLWTRYDEQKLWNNGISAKSGLPWKYRQTVDGIDIYDDGDGNICGIQSD